MNRPSRKQLREALESMPIDAVLGVQGELTHKQKTFAKAVAMGETGANAYRKAYNTKAKPIVVGNEASKLKRHPSIAREIEAYKLAQQAAEYQTPAHLRALVIQTLVQTVINPEVKDAVKVQAAKVLGTVTEVAAFTTTTEHRVIRSSDDAKATLLAKLRELTNNTASDAVVKDVNSLLEEISGAETLPEVDHLATVATSSGNVNTKIVSCDNYPLPDSDSGQVASVTPTPQNDVRSPSATMHNNLHTQISSKSDTPPIDLAQSLEDELMGKTPLGDLK